MIAMQMADEHRVDGGRIDTESMHRYQRGRAEVDEQRARWRLEAERRVGSAAGPEGITAAKDTQRDTRAWLSGHGGKTTPSWVGWVSWVG